MPASLEMSKFRDQVFKAGESPSLIESFGIRRLYGYRTISLSSAHAATILIARNGTGKTTLLGALDAFLRLQLSRLKSLEFEEIFCKIKGVEETIILTRDDIVEFTDMPPDGEVAKFATRLGVSPASAFDFLMSDYELSLSEYYRAPEGSPVAAKVFQTYSYSLPRVTKICREVYDALFERLPRLRNLKNTLQIVLQDYEVVYLPTYRRVELALTDESDAQRPRARNKRRSHINVASDSLHTGDIQFGLSDISDRLRELNREIIVASNSGYRKISENILSDLISGFEVPEDTILPKPEDLKLFFERLESGNRNIGPYYPISAPDFERMFSGEGVPKDSQRFLTYFLGKLNEIVQITRAIEGPVKDFVDGCNKYLSSTEPSTHIDFESKDGLRPIDTKIMRMNRADLSLHVESIPSGGKVKLDALSSGEKQMISLLAKLYLYPKKKIPIIPLTQV